MMARRKITFRDWFWPAALFLVALTLLLSLSGCGTTGSVLPPKAANFGEATAQALVATTAVVQTTTTLAAAGKVTKKQAQFVQDQSTQVQKGIALANELRFTDPGSAQTQLDLALRILQAMQAFNTQYGAK